MRALAFPASNLFSAMVRLAGLVLGAGERRRVVHSLAALDDHMLRDLGLTRFDVAVALAQPATSDATLVLADRAREAQRHDQDRARRTWVGPMPADGRDIAPALPKRAA